jgi:hypothetical protein
MMLFSGIVLGLNQRYMRQGNCPRTWTSSLRSSWTSSIALANLPAYAIQFVSLGIDTLSKKRLCRCRGRVKQLLQNCAEGGTAALDRTRKVRWGRLLFPSLLRDAAKIVILTSSVLVSLNFTQISDALYGIIPNAKPGQMT